MNNRTLLAKEILKELINSESFAPDIKDEDVMESSDGHLVKSGGSYKMAGNNTLSGIKRYSVVNPEGVYVRSAVKFADELIKQTQ